MITCSIVTSALSPLALLTDCRIVTKLFFWRVAGIGYLLGVLFAFLKGVLYASSRWCLSHSTTLNLKCRFVFEYYIARDNLVLTAFESLMLNVFVWVRGLCMAGLNQVQVITLATLPVLGLLGFNQDSEVR